MQVVYLQASIQGFDESYLMQIPSPRQTQKEKKEQAGSLRNVVAGRIVKKYRLVKAVSEEAKLDRRKMTLSASKLITNSTRKRKNTLKSTMSSHIVDFLERDDSSRMMPGKKDFKTVRVDDGLVKGKNAKANSERLPEKCP